MVIACNAMDESSKGVFFCIVKCFLQLHEILFNTENELAKHEVPICSPLAPVLMQYNYFADDQQGKLKFPANASIY